MPGVRAVVTAGDLPHPMPRFGPVVPGPSACWRSARRSSSASRSPRSPPRPRRPPRRRPRSSGSTYEELPGGADRRRRRSTRPRRSCRTRHSREGSAGAHEHPARVALRLGRRRRGARPTASSRTTTRSRWSRTSRSSRTSSSPRPSTTASRSGARSSTRTCSSRGIAKLLGMPIAKVRVIAPDPGGGFGGKQHAEVRAAAGVPRAAHRPARAAGADARGDVPGGPPHRLPGAHAHRASTPTARSCSRTSQPTACSAPTPTSRVRVVSKATYLVCGPYRVPDARVHVRGAAVAHAAGTAFRGFGTPQVAWAVESQMDEAARRLGIDRLEIRLPQPRRPRRGGRAGRHAGRRRLGGVAAQGRRRDRLGRAPCRRVGAAASALGHQVVGDHRRLVRDRAAAHRRQRDGAWPARRTWARARARCSSQIAAEELGLPIEARRDRHGRHRHGAVRPADVGQPLDGLHGHRRAEGLPRRQGAAGGRWRSRRLRRAGRGRRRSATAPASSRPRR